MSAARKIRALGVFWQIGVSQFPMLVLEGRK